MRKSRLFEFLLVFLAVAFVVSLMAEKQEPPEGATEPPKTVADSDRPPGNRPLNIGDKVPNFSLTDQDQKTVTYNEGQGPLLIVLTATGCGECLERISKEDVEAYNLAQARDLQVWNLLVFQNPGGVSSFVDQKSPSADEVLADPSSEISVRTLGGSDQTCWLLIDGEGRLAYRGPVDLTALGKALDSLS